jgi:hypothetical protein
MPRPERPVDASAGSVQQFAASLRKLRIHAGNPTYRNMAQSVHASKASLSDAAAGRRLPTWEITREYVRACGGDLGEWRCRWEETAASLGRKVPPAAAAPAAHRRLGLLLAVAALVLGAGVAAVTTLPADKAAPAVMTSPSERPASFAGPVDPVADNADPKRSGCASNANAGAITTLDKVEVNTADEKLLGELLLRHSPACHSSWGRFEPSNRLIYLHSPTQITITAHRPATGTAGLPYTVAFDGQAAFGNMLLDNRGCVDVTVVVVSPAGGGTATTQCRR